MASLKSIEESKVNYITDVKTKLAANLTAKGQASLGSEDLNALVAKVISILTGKRVATGTASRSSDGTNFRVQVTGLSFKPGYVCGAKIGSSNYALVYNKTASTTQYLAPEGAGAQSITATYKMLSDGFNLICSTPSIDWIAVEE